MTGRPGQTTIHALRRRLGATKRAYYRRWQQRRHNPSGHSRPAFLVGCGRSGTSMIVLHLGRSWQVDAYNEDHPAAFSHWRLRDLDAIETVVAQSRAPITLFKPILETNRSGRLLQRFADARILFAFRHYEDVINSALKKFGPANWPGRVSAWMADQFVEFASAPPPQETQRLVRSLWRPALSPQSSIAVYWLFYNRLFFDLNLDQDERVKLVQYEATVSQPALEFERMCRFLAIRFEERMAAGVFSSRVRSEPTPIVAPEIRAVCDDLWRQLRRQAAAEERV